MSYVGVEVECIYRKMLKLNRGKQKKVMIFPIYLHLGCDCIVHHSSVKTPTQYWSVQNKEWPEL